MFRMTLVAFILVFFSSGFTQKVQNIEPHTLSDVVSPIIVEAETMPINSECQFYRENPFGDGNHYALITSDNYFISDVITLYSDRDCQLSYSTKDSAGYVYSTTGGDTPLTICRENGADDVFNVGGDFYICIVSSNA